MTSQYLHYKLADTNYNHNSVNGWFKIFSKKTPKYKNQFGSEKKTILDGFDFDERIDYIDDFEFETDNENNILKQIIKIFLGKPSVNCVVVELKNSDKTIGELKSFGYNLHCNITKNMKRRSGTIEMFNTMIKYIKNYHPECKRIICSDKADFQCSPDGNTRIPFYNLYLIRYGKGYYEHLFNFQLLDENDKITHNMNIKINKIKVSEYLHQYKYNNIDEFITLLNEGEIPKEILTRIRDEKYCEIIDKFINYIFIESRIIPFIGKLYFIDIE